MPNISLTLLVDSEVKGSAKGLIYKDGEIVYTIRKGQITSSHGQQSLNEVYKSLIKLIGKKYKRNYFNIKIEISK